LAIFLTVRFFSEVAALSQAVAIGWTIYQLSNAPLALGLVGLVEFIPMALLMLPAGELCDRGDPRRVLAAGVALQMLCAAGFLALTWNPGTRLWTMYPVLVLSGVGRAFAEPAGQAVLPLLVSPERLSRAIARGSSVWQVAVIPGPALGGIAYSVGPTDAYAICGAGFLLALLAIGAVGGRRSFPSHKSMTLRSRFIRMREGMQFIRSRPIVFGAISLDLVSVLLGGATALLPIYARDILHSGPIGLGLLRSAPALGACLIALYQARHPPDRRVGLQLFVSITAFGLGTIMFGLSRSLALSLSAPFIIGAADMVSVNIRSSLVQGVTPDALRGRVSAFNMLFVGTSSELGAFESGLVAAFIGVVPCVVAGGVGVLLATVVWARVFPSLRQMDQMPSAPPMSSNRNPQVALPSCCAAILRFIRLGGNSHGTDTQLCRPHVPAARGSAARRCFRGFPRHCVGPAKRVPRRCLCA
jgi:MFS family permease